MDTPSEPRRTAFICAMPMELRPLARKLSLHRTQIGGVSVSSGTLDGREVVAIVTGMGPKLASEATNRLLDAVSVDRVIVVGHHRRRRERHADRDTRAPRGRGRRRDGCRASARAPR